MAVAELETPTTYLGQAPHGHGVNGSPSCGSSGPLKPTKAHQDHDTDEFMLLDSFSIYHDESLK